MARQEFKAGDKVVFGRGKSNRAMLDITVGKIYTLWFDVSLVFTDDEGDAQGLAEFTEAGGKPTKVLV